MKTKLLALLCVLLTLGALFLVGCSEQELSSAEQSQGTPSQLQTPVVTIEGDKNATWGAISGAVAYEYKINDGEIIRVDASTTSIKLLGTEKIVVRAIGNGTSTTNSEWSTPVYVSVPQLPKPALSVQSFGDAVVVTWDRDARASGYKYRLNADAEKMLEGDFLGFQIAKGDTLYVCAIGNGTDYLDSDWAIVKPE